MKKLAITGGIGTGKTFISKQFIAEGIPVFYADEEAKLLYSDPEVLRQIREAFGDSVFDGNRLDFSKMAAIVFNDDAQLQRLNAIIHPLVMKKFDEWASRQHAEAVMMESAIIFEAHLEHYFDKVYVVNASLPTRMDRIRRRNPELSDSEILARINAQLDQAVKCSLADEVIEHDVDL
ncbi:MAG: dephospho-CoA kinase [Bacteroidales bacterium]|jgi:dephospho-CoA kinase|nr:dephospho-CoA kinase [Bacteroidales bacterium]